MLKAILREGVITPLEPLPPEWQDGVALEVARADAQDVEIDSWAKSMNELCADSTTDDEEAMRRAIDEHRQQVKAQTRRDMGLSRMKRYLLDTNHHFRIVESGDIAQSQLTCRSRA